MYNLKPNPEFIRVVSETDFYIIMINDIYIM